MSADVARGSGVGVRSRLARLAGPVLLVLAAVLQVGIHVSYAEPLSPFDEYFQLDYVAGYPDRPLLRTGEEMGDYALDQIECRGIWGAEYPGADCTGVEGDPRPDLFENKNLADVHSPAYFATTWVLSLPFQALGFDVLEAARLTNVFWLSGGLLLFYGLARSFGASRVAATATGLLLAGSPAVFWSNTFLSIDASALAAGAGLLWLGARYLRGSGPSWPLVAVAAAAVAFKFHNIAAVALVVLALLAFAVLAARRPDGDVAHRPLRVVAIAVATTVAAMAVQLAWVGIRAALALGPRPDDGATEPLGIRRLLDEVWGPLAGAIYNDGVGGTLHLVVGPPLLALGAAGVIGLLVVRPVSAQFDPTPLWQRVWPGAVLAACLLVGPAFVAATYLVEHRYFDIPPRYALSLVPGVYLLTTLLLDRARWARWALLGVAALVYVTSLTFV